jgi:hypothetical protein
MLMGKVPAAVAVPLKVPVPLPLSTKLTPAGKVPITVRLGAGNPRLVTRKELATFRVKVVPATLVIAGDSSTVKVKACRVEPALFDALKVIA